MLVSVPPVAAHVTSAVLPTSCAVKSVGPVIETVPDVPDGLIVSDGDAPPLVDPHPQSDAPKSQAAATSNERMNSPKANEVEICRSHAYASRAGPRTLTLYQRNAALCWPTSGEPVETCS